MTLGRAAQGYRDVARSPLITDTPKDERTLAVIFTDGAPKFFKRHKAESQGNELPPLGSPGRPLMPDTLGAWTYRRETDWAGPTLGDDRRDFARADAEYAAKGSNGVVIIDDLLSPSALEEMWRFCLDSTIYWEAKNKGYVGAYAEEGFSSPLIMAIADELRERLPNMLGKHQFTQAWAYAYAQDSEWEGESGIRNHADPGAINVNLWLTPDSSNMAEDDERLPHGGMVVYPVHPPEDSTYKDFNSEKNKAKVDAFVENDPRGRGARALGGGGAAASK